jgi:hypothetical protein
MGLFVSTIAGRPFVHKRCGTVAAERWASFPKVNVFDLSGPTGLSLVFVD